MRKSVFIILIILQFIMVMFMAPTLAQDEQTVAEFTLDIDCYAPTKITFNYAYTNEHSIYDISTVGQSLYKHTGGPTYMEFIAEDVDDYFFSMSLSYLVAKNQTILVGIWSGTEAMDGFDYKLDAQETIFHVRLRVKNQPGYPSEEQVANQVVVQVQKNLDNYYRSMEQLMQRYNLTVTTNSVLAIVSIIFMIVFGGVMLLEIRRLRARA